MMSDTIALMGLSSTNYVGNSSSIIDKRLWKSKLKKSVDRDIYALAVGLIV